MNNHMMDYYVISPVSDLKPMLLGDRIFVLAHLWVKYPHYREFILEQAEDNRWITLDNSAAERSLVTEDVLINICHELQPNEVIAPDVLFDKEQTIENAKSFKARMDAEGLSEWIDIFFCPQGETKEEWLEAYKWGLEQDWIQTIGLSKIAVPKAWFTEYQDDQNIALARTRCYQYLLDNDLLKKPIHCLGQGSPDEFTYYNHPMMRSTDSVFPILAASVGQLFDDDAETRVPTPHDFLEKYDMNEINMELVHANIAYLDERCKTIKTYPI